MKTKFSDILKNSWPYGLILALVSILINLLLYIFDVNIFSIAFGIFSFLVMLIAIPSTFGILGGKNLRVKYSPDRVINYVDAVSTIFIILLIGLLLSSCYSYIFNNFIDPDYMKSQLAKLVEMLERYNLPQEKIDETIANSQKNFQIGRMLLSSCIISVVLALLISIFIRKKDKFDDKII